MSSQVKAYGMDAKINPEVLLKQQPPVSPVPSLMLSADLNAGTWGGLK